MKPEEQLRAERGLLMSPLTLLFLTIDELAELFKKDPQALNDMLDETKTRKVIFVDFQKFREKHRK